MGIQISVLLLRAADQADHAVCDCFQLFIGMLCQAVGNGFEPLIRIRILERRSIESQPGMRGVLRPRFKDIGRIHRDFLSRFPVPDHLRSCPEIMNA